MLHNENIIYYYPVFAAIMLILVVLFLTKKEIKELFWYGLIWGFLGSLIFIFLCSGVFHLFEFKRIYPFLYLGVSPVWNNLAWVPTIMIYIHFLPSKKERYFFPLYLFTFAILSTLIDDIYQHLGMMKYIHWNLFYRFIIALVWFYGVTWHYNKVKSKGTDINETA